MFEDFYNKFEVFYNKYYIYFLLLPILLFIIAIFSLTINYRNTGDIVDRDVSLTGGVTATVYGPANLKEIEDGLKKEFPDADFNVRGLGIFETATSAGFIVEITDVSDEDLKIALDKIVGLKEGSYSFEETGSALGNSFYKQMLRSILIAFTFMSIVIFVSFRKLAPSIAIIISPIFNIVMVLSVINLIGMKISTAGIAAILLTIGYSIDTDVVLTNRILKKKEGSINKSIISAMKTGLTMTLTTVVALTAGYLFSKSIIIKEMFLIILIALFFDLIATYVTNAGILKWYFEREKL